MSKKCDRCDIEMEGLEWVKALNAELCRPCLRALMDEVEFYKWKDSYTEEQHTRAMKLLRETEEIECVKGDYDDGRIVLHTKYVSSDVVTDFCNHFGFILLSFGPQWEENEMWSCMHEHGDIFEIVLRYDHTSEYPVPVELKFYRNHLPRLTDNDKQF
jgi:hypothetical protein